MWLPFYWSRISNIFQHLEATFISAQSWTIDIIPRHATMSSPLSTLFIIGRGGNPITPLNYRFPVSLCIFISHFAYLYLTYSVLTSTSWSVNSCEGTVFFAFFCNNEDIVQSYILYSYMKAMSCSLEKHIMVCQMGLFSSNVSSLLIFVLVLFFVSIDFCMYNMTSKLERGH